MRLVDANVFIYALGTSEIYRDPCRTLLDRIRIGGMGAVTDVEVLQEVLHHFHRMRATERGVRAVRDVLVVFPNPIEVTRSTIERSLDLLTIHPRLQSRDAVHAAVVLEHRLEGIISADRAFDAIAGLTRFDPLDLGKSW